MPKLTLYGDRPMLTWYIRRFAMAASMMHHLTNVTQRLETLVALFLRHLMSIVRSGSSGPYTLLAFVIHNIILPFPSTTLFSSGWSATEQGRQNVLPLLFCKNDTPAAPAISPPPAVLGTCRFSCRIIGSSVVGLRPIWNVSSPVSGYIAQAGAGLMTTQRRGWHKANKF